MRIRRLTALCVSLLVFATAPAIAAAANDNLADATVVAGVPYTDTTDTTEATTEAGEPLPCDMAGATVWYRFAASQDANLVADTFGSDFDTVLGIYRATAPDPTFGDLEIVDCNDQAGGGDQSRVDFAVAAGETYYVQAGGWSLATILPLIGTSAPAQGELVVNLNQPAAISGKVTDPGGQGLSGACVEIFDPTEEYYYLDGTITDDDGNYSIGVPPGSVKIHFIDCNFYNYDDEWYNDKQDFSEADVVDVAPGEVVTGIDASLSVSPPLPPGPPSDLDVTELTVTNVPVTTDYGDVAYSGWMRRVTATVTNIGDADADDSWVDVYVCPQQPLYYSCTFLGGEYIQSLPSGESRTFVMRWNGLGGVGDFTVEAYAWASNELNYDNNYESVDHYVIVGGIGVGVAAGY